MTLPPATRTVDDVIADMTSLGESMEAAHGKADGVVRFNSLYLQVTKGVGDALAGQQDFFAVPDAMHRLDVIFGQLYLDAVADLAAAAHVPHCWNALFEVRDHTGIASLQFVLGGMNAHIDHDLSCALLSQWEEAGERPHRGSDAHRDFTKVNQILESRLDAEKALLLTGIIKDLDRETGPIDDRVAMFGIEASRELAWVRAERLWDVRRMRIASDAMLAVIDEQVAILGRALLQPIV
jgi:Family of unknown function (DUF5995)